MALKKSDLCQAISIKPTDIVWVDYLIFGCRESSAANNNNIIIIVIVIIILLMLLLLFMLVAEVSNAICFWMVINLLIWVNFFWFIWL